MGRSHTLKLLKNNTMNKDFLIRTTQGTEIGSGHFYRSLALSLKLIKNGYHVEFVVTNNESKNILEKSNIPYRELGDITEEECLQKCKEIVNSETTLIVDLPFHNEIYSKEFQNVCKTIILDDLGNKEIFSEMLFNGSIVEEYHNYKIKNNQTRLFLGSEYMIIREDFLDKRELVNISTKSIHNVLVTFGGSDDLGLSSKIIPCLASLPYEITLIMGPNYQKKMNDEKIEDFHNVKIEKTVNDMASVMAQQDLVISASGIASYELACLGIPTIFIPTGKYQIPTAYQMEKEGFGINYGLWDGNIKKFKSILKKFGTL